MPEEHPIRVRVLAVAQIMCGIFATLGKPNNAPALVFQGLTDIEYRGYDSWGVAFLNYSGFEVVKKIGFLPKSQVFPKSNVSIGHTRWATHGGVTEENAHPHLDCTRKLSLVHNGIVENYLELKNQLKDHQFKSQTDTEIIVHLIESLYAHNHDLAKSTGEVFKKLQGFNAIVISDGKNIVACKNGSPLVIGKAKNSFYVASDPNAILPHTKNLIFLEDNQMATINSEVTLHDLLKNRLIPTKFVKVLWKYTCADLGVYPNFMIKEILEQPQVISKIAKQDKKILKVTKMIKSAFGTYMIGCGSAAYACLAGMYLFSKYSKKHINFSVGSEFNYLQDYLTDKSLLIAISQSGETIDTVEPVVESKKRGAKIVALTNSLGSTLYREANENLNLGAGVEKAVASSKAFTAMLAYMIILSHAVVGKLLEAKSTLKKSSKEIENVIKKRPAIIQLAEKLASYEHIYILGRGLSYPIALEAALKIKELSYIHAEGFAAGELKHGFLALISKGTPVIVFLANDESKDASLANAMEVKARGGYVIGVGFINHEVFDEYFEIKDTGASSIIPHTVFAQLLAYQLALKLDRNPDKPRNLAKSVVVR